MPTYSHNVPDSPAGPSLPIRRTPAYAPLVAIVTSDDLIGTYTHFYKGRTHPCEKPNCDACNDGISYRWHAYMTAWETKTALHFIFEVTAAAAQPFTEYRDHHGALRGCLFEARRWQARPNGRILIQCKPVNLKELRIPQPPDIQKCLAVLWSLPDTAVETKSYDPERDMPRTTIDPDEKKKGDF